LDYRNYVTPTTVSGDAILGDWRWLTGPALQLWFATKLGDAMLTDPRDGSVHFLDTIRGTVTLVAPTTDAFQSVVLLRDNAENWFLPDVVDKQAALGVRPGPDECISLKLPPVLGGALTPDNFETCSVLLHFSVAGQIHKHAKDLPPGTTIDKFTSTQPATG
jgi:hypothetical protein